MDIKDYEKKVLNAISELSSMPNRKEHTKQSALVHLMEEIGEISREITNEEHRPEKFSKEKLASEIADSMMFIVLLAKLCEVDLSKEMRKSIERLKKKAEVLE